MEKYINHECLDFAADDYFLQWVKHPDKKNSLFWESYILNHPEKSEAINEAVVIINSIAPPLSFTEDEKAALWQNITAGIRNPKPGAMGYKYKYLVAACIAALLISSIFIIKGFYNNALVNVHTGYAQKMPVTLPDGSTVILNANSSIKFPQKFVENKAREVWIDGEACFNIKHLNKNPQIIKNSERFIVHANNMNIEVLGTTFNVYRRHNDTRVALIQGKVQVSFSNQQDKLIMKPGEIVSYTATNKKYSKAVSNANLSALWVNNKINLKDTPLSDIKTILQDNYGLTVQFEDEATASIKLSGEIPTNNLDILIKALSGVLGKPITKTGNNLIIHK